MLVNRSPFIRVIIAVIILSAVLEATAESHDHGILFPGTIKSASELDYPPFSIIKSDGTPDGFSVDLLKAVVQTFASDISFKVGPWNEIKQQLIDGHLDVLPLVSYSDDRDKIMDFSVSYLRMQGTIFVRKQETSIKGIRDLKDKEVLVMKGDTAHDYALKNKVSDNLILKASYEEAMKALSSGSHDAVIIQQLVGFELIKKLNISNIVEVGSFKESNLKPAVAPLSDFEQKFCFAVPKGNKQLLSHLNEGLTIVITNGTYNKIYNKWFGPILPKPSLSPVMIAKYVLLILVPFTMIITIIGYLFLKKEIGRKTRYLEKEISVRKVIENALQESEEKYRILLEESNDPIFSVTPEGQYKFVNRAFGKGVKKNPNDIIGKNFWDIFPEKEADKRFAVLTEVVETGVEKIFEACIPQKNISNYYLTTITPVKDHENKVLSVICSSKNITDRKQAEFALQESEFLFSQMFEQSMVATCLFNPEGTIIKVNREFCKMFGVDEKILIKESYNVFKDQSIIEAGLIHLIKDLFYQKKTKHWEMNFDIDVASKSTKTTTSKTGKIFLEIFGYPVVDTKNNLEYVVLQHYDITERKQSEDEKEKLEAQLQQARKMETIGTLAGGIAHDFNNILFPLIGFAEMLKEDLPSDSPGYQDITEVLHAAFRARDLVKQILAFSRQGDQEIKPIKLQIILKEVVNLLRSTIPKTIDIQTKIDPDCGLVIADATQMHQIIMNLTTNAYHAMQESGGQLKISLTQTKIDSKSLELFELAQGRYALLKITDTGVGIKKELMDKIFDPYFTTKEQGKGTGLGLSVVHGIVKSNNGYIHVYSEPGKGTEVHVYLPILKNQSDDSEPVSLKPVQGGNERILLVDDEKMIIKMEERILTRLGYKITGLTDSVKTLKIFKQNPEKYDLVITDMTMPNMTGTLLANEIKKIRPDIPIIICTGFSDQINKNTSQEFNIDCFIMKPIILNDIALAIRNVLDSP